MFCRDIIISVCVLTFCRDIIISDVVTFSGSGSGEDNDKAIGTPPVSPRTSPKSPLKISGGKKRVRTASNST